MSSVRRAMLPGVTAAARAAAASNRRGITLVAMTGALSMILIDETVVSVALPSIQVDLDLSATDVQWILNAYLLTLAALVAVAGRLSDAFGRVRFFVLGVALFAVTSAAAGLATEAWHILAARSVQGVGAAMMIPSSQAIVTTSFPLDERGRAMGIYAGISMGFLAMGPLIGGILTEDVGWEWVFFINVPVAALTLGLTFIARPSGGRVPRGRLDVTGAVLLVAGLSLFVFALMQSSAWSWGDPSVVGGLVAGGVLLVAFVACELRRRSPLVQLRVLRSGNFAADNLVLFMTQFAVMGITVFGAIYLQDVLGFSPASAGVALLPLTVPILIIAAPVGRLYDRAGPRSLVTTGAFIMACSFVGSAVVVTTFDYWWLAPCLAALGLGIGLIMTPANTDGMNAAPPSKRGEAAGLLQTIRQVGATFGIAVLTTVVVHRNRRHLDAELQSDFPGKIAKKLEGLLSEAEFGDTSRFETVLREGGQSASRVRQDLDQVIDVAKDAFADGLRGAFAILAALMLLSAIVAFFVLRKVDYASVEAEGEPVGPHPLPHASPHPPSPAPRARAGARTG